MDKLKYNLEIQIMEQETFKGSVSIKNEFDCYDNNSGIQML